MSAAGDKMSREEERKLLELASRVFAENFPNSSRLGCPSQQILRAMAFREHSLSLDDAPVDHLTVCSPCFQDYFRYRRMAKHRAYMWNVGIAATVLIAVIGAGLWISGRSDTTSQSAGGQAMVPQVKPELPVLHIRYDLRRWSRTRSGGDERKSRNGTALKCFRKRVWMTFLLPIGSQVGAYDVVFSRLGNVLASARANAQRRNDVVVLEVQIDLTDAAAGPCHLRIQQVGSIWHDFPVNLE